jgi:hypothetical protein
VKVLHYDGTPITAIFIAGAIRSGASATKLAPQQSHG